MLQEGSFSNIVFLGGILSLAIDSEVAHYRNHHSDNNKQ